jgi:hypothetical protein
VVLRRALLLLLLVGCKQSLFETGDDDATVDSGMTGDGMVQTSCGAMCLGDSGADFGDAKWEYLEDKRNRTWTAMTASGSDFVGADANNKISSCATASKPACSSLPGALLMSSAGGTSATDPAIAFTSPAAQVIKVSLRVRVEGNAAQQVRLYRNSREDSLFTAVAQPGVTLETSMQVDALPSDRFVFALTPADTRAEDVAVQLFINGTGLSFPQQCLMGVQWNEAQTSGKALNECGNALTYYDDSSDTTTQTPTVLGAGPFAELGTAAMVDFDHYMVADAPVDRTGDMTTQFWLKQSEIGFTDCVPFSDSDLDKPGGLEVFLVTNGNFGAGTCNDNVNYTFNDALTTFPQDMDWHFIRIVHTGGRGHLCVDGQHRAAYDIPASGMTTAQPVHLGRTPYNTTEQLKGGYDDLRIYKGALPCE